MRCCGEVVMDVVGAYSPHRQSYRGIDLIGSRTGITRGVGVKAIGLWLRLAVGLQASHEGAECFPWQQEQLGGGDRHGSAHGPTLMTTLLALLWASRGQRRLKRPEGVR